MKRWHVIASLCRTANLLHGAELGVRDGRFARSILALIPNSTIIGVDTWKALPPRKVEGSETYEKWPMTAYRAACLKLASDFHGRCTMLELTTTAASKCIPDESLDFVFIDADHTEEAVRSDINNWLPKIRKGGLLSGHDISWPSVKNAVTSFGTYQVAGDDVWYKWI